MADLTFWDYWIL